ncbi:DUF4270 domain-containing protein [Hymenobacter sp. BT507]|uniref:DUF4270 domain-containing protein n=1 Tax=Hymenobacter citatus TaxID=2763506 RepID=A0ABR7MKZ8_9BACT|nr:DUF4270 family protein [Hymenobacter citatus]MBC6611762.1 DUF4270 domain-containing protein [Hymenobacter citatus]
MRKKTKQRRPVGGWLIGRLLLLMGSLVALLLTSCEEANDIGLDMQATNGAGGVYVDTFTVRTSTVLLDSVPTSTSSYLLVGRYRDSRLGTVEARSFVQLGLESAFTPVSTSTFDSLVLVLPADAYRYGDTTRTQHLEVHRLTEQFSPTTTYYTVNTLAYASKPLVSKTMRARSGARSIRLRLPDALGQELMTLGRAGRLSTADELAYYLKGLVVTPDSTDNAALIRFAATSAGLTLYYHDSGSPSTALTQEFPVSTRHFYQLRNDRRGTLLASLQNTRQAVPSSQTAEETFVEGGLGLYTKIEIPYLLNLNDLSGMATIVSAQLVLEEVPSAEQRPYMPPPTSLTLRLTDASNRAGALFTTSDGTAHTFSYTTAQSARTGLQQGQYTLDLTAYLAGLVRRTSTNTGLLLSPSSAESPDRAILGSFRNTSHQLQLRIYYTKSD